MSKDKTTQEWQPKVIYKYEISLAARHILKLPRNSKILSLQVQNIHIPCIWVLHDPKEKSVIWEFKIFTTGEEIKEKLFEKDYIGTFQMYEGAFVGHLFGHIDSLKQQEENHE